MGRKGSRMLHETQGWCDTPYEDILLELYLKTLAWPHIHKQQGAAAQKKPWKP